MVLNLIRVLAAAHVGDTAAALSVPSGLNQPSPTFSAQPFTARIVLFEEFGTQDYNDAAGIPKFDPKKTTLPPPIDPVTGLVDCFGYPGDGKALDNLIGMNSLWPVATEASFQDDLSTNPGKLAKAAASVAQNPWSAAINACEPATNGLNMPADGRPYGKDFAHQRWNEKNAITGDLEFQPKKFFQSVMAGARPGGGVRDKMQLHGYKQPTNGKFSEFGPGGLYFNTVTSPYAFGGPLNRTLSATEKAQEATATPYIPAFEGTTKGIPVQLHPKMPVQTRSSVWTFDGTIPPKLLMARYGETILLRHHNALPIVDNLESNRGFGAHTISTHEHNGHNPAESDGFAGAYFYPGQYYDYVWPMTLAGHDSINTKATDKRAGAPCSATEKKVGGYPCVNGIAQVPGDYRETMSTHWFHDHMLDFTAQNVYKGNAATMNYYSAVDRGNEEINDGVNLRLPSGTAREWGNRDYDVNLVIGDKAFDSTGQLYFNPLFYDGFLGDIMTVNWVYKPYMDVRARRYRFRILNGSVSRYMKLALAYQNPTTKAIVQVPMHIVANDGNLMQHSVAIPNTQAGEGLPVISIAERFDIVVDFAPLYGAGVRRLYMVNLMEHNDGRGPIKTPVTLKAAFDAFNKANTAAYQGKDLAIGKFMEFRLRPLPAGQTDKSMNPANFVEGKSVMLPLPTFTAAELASAQHRTFDYVRGGGGPGDSAPWSIKTDGGPSYNADIDRISAAPTKGSVEIWHMTSNAGGWSHPAHIHFEEGQIIARDGTTPPAWERLGRKDMYRLGPEFNGSKQVDVAVRVRDFTGTYVQHCHNTQHEDHAMLLRWDSETPDHATWVRTPYPTWTGAGYYNGGVSYKVPTADTGSKATSQASSFKLPAGWGGRAADVPVTAAPAP